MTLPIFCCIRLEEQKWSVHLVLPYTETVTWVEKFISVLESKSIAQCSALLQQCSCYLYQSFQWHIDWSKKKKKKIPFLDPATLAQPADTDRRGTAVLLSRVRRVPWHFQAWKLHRHKLGTSVCLPSLHAAALSHSQPSCVTQLFTTQPAPCIAACSKDSPETSTPLH